MPDKFEPTLLLLKLCEKMDVRVRLEFDTGRVVNGSNIPIIDGHPDLNADLSGHIEQEQKGWQVEVGMETWVDENENEIKYPTLRDASMAGLRLLKALEVTDD